MQNLNKKEKITLSVNISLDLRMEESVNDDLFVILTFNTEIKEIADVTGNGADELDIGEEDM